MNAIPKIRLQLIPHILCLLIFVGFSWEIAIGQNNYTVGTGYGTNHAAIIFAPFGWEGNWGNSTYHDHACLASDWSSGQQYDWPDFPLIDASGPYAEGGKCTLDEFYNFIHDHSYEMGTLLVSGHGHDNKVATDVFARVPAAYDYWYSASDWYDMFYDWSSYYIEEQANYLIIGATNQFVRQYGNLGKSLVYLNSDYGSTLTDDFVAAGARVAVGNIDSTAISLYSARVDSFFSRMDGQSGRENRPVSAARNGLSLGTAGALNTTLAPAVVSVQKPDTLQEGNKMTITLDTKCDTWLDPTINAYFCILDLDSIRWVDSTSIQIVLTDAVLIMPQECLFGLQWAGVSSANNWSFLDGNTDPYGGFNARGPAHDDYEWTAIVEPCDCADWTGDLDCSYTLSPVDVVLLINFVYKNQDARCFPSGWNCPQDLGDANCDGAVNPVDVVAYVNHVYKNWQPFPLCPDPCEEQQLNICEK